MGVANVYMNIAVYKADMIWYYEEWWWYTNGDVEYIYIMGITIYIYRLWGLLVDIYI